MALHRNQVGSFDWLAVVWLIAGGLTIGGALFYGELVAMMSSASGMHVRRAGIQVPNNVSTLSELLRGCECVV